MSTTQNLAHRARQAWAQKQARDAEWGLWANVSDLPHLRELMAWFCEGKLSFTPGHNGPRDSETEGAVGAALAHANRSGFLTTNSQNGGDDRGDQWRSYVLGLADDATVAALRAAVDGTRLAMQATAQRFFGQDGTTPGTHQKPDGTAYGSNPVPSWRDTARDFHGIPDDVMSQVTHLNYVQIVDPQWGPSDLLWNCLSALGKDKPSTAPPAKTTPTTTGAAMTSGVSYGGLKAVIMGSSERIPEHAGLVRQVIAGIDGEITQLLAANEDSGKLDEAIALLMQAKEKLEESATSLGAAVQSADSAAAALS